MLSQLESFIAISDLRSVSAAAKRLYLTQPALTQHVRFLEAQFGAKLLVRVGNAMEPTPEGKRLYDAAKGLVEQVGKLKAIFSDQGAERWLRFATIDSVTLSILPAAIQKLLKSIPGIRLEPQLEASGLATEHLLAGKLDCALCTLDHLPPTLGKELLFKERLVFIGAPEHRSIRKASELEAIPIILFPKSSMTRALIDATLGKLKVAPPVALETIKVSAIVSLVEAGLGTSIVPFYSVHRDLALGRIVELPIATKAARGVGVAFPKDRPLSAATLAFIRCLRQASADLLKRSR